MSEKPRWVVFEITEQGLLRIVDTYEAHDWEAACWWAAEGPLREQAMSDKPPKLGAIRESRYRTKPFALETTVKRKRVKP